MSTCNKCGDSLSDCCGIASPPQIIGVGKYVNVSDACGNSHVLDNRDQSILTSKDGQVSLNDGSNSSKIFLSNLRSVAGLDKIVGISSGALASISLEDGQVLQNVGGNMVPRNLTYPVCFSPDDVIQYNNGGYLSFLTIDDLGNYCLNKLSIVRDSTDSNNNNQVVAFDRDGGPVFFDFFDMKNSSDSCALYYWDKLTKKVEKLLPPNLSQGQVYSDYVFRLNDSTGCPEWYLVNNTAVAPAMGLFSSSSAVSTASPATAVSIPLIKNFDGGGSIARFATSGGIKPNKAGQVYVQATGQAAPISADQVNLIWLLNGVQVSTPQGRSFVKVAGAGPETQAIWAGQMSQTDILTLAVRTELSTATMNPVSVFAMHMSANA